MGHEGGLWVRVDGASLPVATMITCLGRDQYVEANYEMKGWQCGHAL